MQTETGKLATRGGQTLVIKLAAAGMTYVFSIVLARITTPTGFGQVAFFLNTTLLLSVIGAAGQQMALVRYLPALRKAGAFDEMQSLRARAFWLAAAATLATVLIAAICVGVAKSFGQFSGFSWPVLVLGAGLVLAVGLADFQAHLARSLHMVRLSLIPKEVLWRGLVLCCALVLFWATGAFVSTVLVMSMLVLTLLGVTAAQWIVMRAGLPDGRRTGPISQDWRGSVFPFWVTSVSNIFLANADVVIVGIALGPEAAGYYFAANRLAMLLAFFMTSYNVVLAPMLSESWHAGDLAKTRSLIHSAVLRMCLPTLAVAIPLMVFAEQALAFFGPEFAQAAGALRILVLAGVLNAVTGPADIALNMCGREKTAMRVGAVSLVVNAVVLVGATVMWGSSGTALAVLVGTCLRKGLFWAMALSRLGLRTDLLACLLPEDKSLRALKP
ncbi:MAG: lipopolysaccharide biosynthesis protein [Marinosulfonomonas sp.]